MLLNISYQTFISWLCLFFITFSLSAQPLFKPITQAPGLKPLRIALLKVENTSATETNIDVLNGFLHEFWQIWSIDNRQEIEFIYLSKKQAKQALQNKSIDIIAINETDDRQPNSLLSIPYANNIQKVYRRNNSKKNKKLSIGIHTHDKNALSFISNQYSRTYFQDIDTLIANQQAFDLLYSTNPVLLESKLEEIKQLHVFTANDDDSLEIHYHFSTRKNDRGLLYAINESIRKVSRLQAQLWANKYLTLHDNLSLTFGNYLSNMSENEKQFVIDHNQLVYPITPQGQPPYIISEQGSNFGIKGLSIDITKIATEKTGLIFKPMEVNDNNSSIAAIIDNKADILITARKNNPVKGLLSYSIPYINNYYNLIRHKDYTWKGQYQDLARVKIAIVKDLPATQVLQQSFSRAKFNHYPTIAEALTAVQNGQSDVYIGSPLITNYFIQTKQLSRLMSSPLTDFPEKSTLSFATPSKNKNLTTLLNKTLNSITSHQFNDMYTKWHKKTVLEVNNKKQVATAYRNMSVILAITVIICLIIFWIYYRQLQTRKAAQLKVEQELTNAEAARIDAEQSAQAKVAFLARMSHEIRTPMNGVLGMSEALSFTELDGKQQELLDTLNGSARNLLALLNNVLDFSKMDAGKLTLESVPINLHNLSKNIINGFKHLYSESEQKKNNDIDVRLTIDPDITHLYVGDPTRLTQVLNNLLSNAVKFTEKGHVTMAIKLESSRNINNTICDTINFSVTDSGIGIAPETQAQLFNPFTQADSAITRKYGGTGLGLSICQEIVNAMGGKVELKSEINKGSCFYFQIRFQRAGVEEKVAERRINPRNIHTNEDYFKSLRVLVAEDNLVNVLVITAQLERLNIKPDIAENGDIALKKHRKEPYDIIISDCHMPVLDGFELARKLSIDKSKRPLWLIAITAEALSGAAEKCFSAGFDDFLAKPCPQEEINNKLYHAYRELERMKNS